MIDTIILTIPREMFEITNPERWDPPATWLHDEKRLGGRGSITCKYNRTDKEKRLGYGPTLTLTKRYVTGGYQTKLKVQVSLAKLFFNGQNFNELVNNDFYPLVADLRLQLNNLGVEVDYSNLAIAAVSAVHYSKNTPFTDGTTTRFFVEELRKSNINGWLDVDQKDYRNEGHIFKLHAKSYEVVFYDKLHDLGQAKKSESRAIETDNYSQLSLLPALRNAQRQNRLELPRFEVRLNTKAKIRSELKAIGMERELTFNQLFDSKIAQAILIRHLNKFEDQRPTLLDYQPKNPEAMLSDLVINNPGLAPRKILQLLGLKVTIDQVGMRATRIILGKASQRTWYSLVSESKKIKLPVKRNAFRLLREQLEEFRPLKLEDYTLNDK